MKSTPNANVNFIKHLDVFLEVVNAVDAINYSHIALYISLFRIWNISYFQNPITPTRDDVMKYAGLKSRESFYRLIREIEALDLIRYYPSKSKYEKSFYCLSQLESHNDNIKITVWALSNHEGLNTGQKDITNRRSVMQGNSVSIFDLQSKTELFNGRGKLYIEKTFLLNDKSEYLDQGQRSDTPTFDPKSDPRYHSSLTNTFTSPVNNYNNAINQNPKSSHSRLRPSGIPTDPNADYSKPL